MEKSFIPHQCDFSYRFLGYFLLFIKDRSIVCLFSDKINDYLITNRIDYIETLCNACAVIHAKYCSKHKVTFFFSIYFSDRGAGEF